MDKPKKYSPEWWKKREENMPGSEANFRKHWFPQPEEEEEKDETHKRER